MTGANTKRFCWASSNTANSTFQFVRVKPPPQPFAPIAQLVRAPGLYPGGPWFKSRWAHQCKTTPYGVVLHWCEPDQQDRTCDYWFYTKHLIFKTIK